MSEDQDPLEDKMRAYNKVYEDRFFERADGIVQWKSGRLKYGDALACIAYACGCPSWEDFRAFFKVTEGGRDNDGPLALEQINSTFDWWRGRPKSVLEVGSGRGEVSLAFQYKGIKVRAVEPHPLAWEWMQKTWEKLYHGDLQDLGRGILVNLPCPECLKLLDLSDVDTMIFCESLEHIPAEDFAPFWKQAGESLRKNSGMLIVANWMDYHPIGIGDFAHPDEHCRIVDDAFYKDLSEGGTVIYQSGSHLVVQY